MRDSEAIKLATRPSPSVHASRHRVGTRRTGNDGLMYEVSENAAGVRQWKPTDAAKAFVKACREKVEVLLIPEIHRWVNEYDTVHETKPDVRLLASKQALAVIWKSASALAVFLEGRAYVRKVRWDDKTRTYVLELGSKVSVNEVCTEARSVYGEAGIAGDTWMEDDIRVDAERELRLRLSNCLGVGAAPVKAGRRQQIQTQRAKNKKNGGGRPK